MKFDKLCESIIDDYRGQHTAPMHDSGSPLHDLSNTYPEDVYSNKAALYYGHFGNNDVMDREAASIIQSYHNKPNKSIRIYRAVPTQEQKKVIQINRGDWVTISKTYAKEHGESALDGNYKIISKVVKAKDIFTNGDSLLEWGYDPQ